MLCAVMLIYNTYEELKHKIDYIMNRKLMIYNTYEELKPS